MTKTGSKKEDEFLQMWNTLYPALSLALQYKRWEKELAIALGRPSRRRSFDFAHVPSRTAIEYQGGVFMVKSGHKGKGAQRDALKSIDAGIVGWQVIPICTGQINRHNLEKIKMVIDYRSSLLCPNVFN